MIVLYLAFGLNQHIHHQVAFSAITILSWNNPNIEVIIFTDVPKFYQLLQGRVKLRVPKPATLADWKGPYNYFFRVKIKALQEILKESSAHHLLYLDGDTFCFGDPAKLVKLLENGNHLMHAREGKLGTLPTKTEQRMWKMCSGRSFGGVRVTEQSTMYNAGVIGLHREKAAVAAECALAVCDDLLKAEVPERLVEQLAFSLALAEYGGVKAANHSIGHYWGNKVEWNHFISDFFVRQSLECNTIDIFLKSVRLIDFQAIPVYRKQSSTHRKLTQWVDKHFFNDRQAFASTEEGANSDMSDRKHNAFRSPL